MQQVVRTAFVPHAPADVFALVADVGRYPEFLPWCTEVHVLSSTPDGAKARFVVGLGPITGSFSAHAHFRPEKEIRLSLIEGIFSSFEGCWTFEACGGGTRIRLDLRFQFGRGGGFVLEMLFRRAADKLVAAFQRRADELCGVRRTAGAPPCEGAGGDRS